MELFYKDKARWSYTFQNCAILTRLLDTIKILKEWKPVEGKVPIIITERSVLTDRHVFADMLHKQGIMDDLEWNLYLKWFHAFAEDLPVKGIIHLATGVQTSKDRIKLRDRAGEDAIPLEYHPPVFNHGRVGIYSAPRSHSPTIHADRTRFGN